MNGGWEERWDVLRLKERRRGHERLIRVEKLSRHERLIRVEKLSRIPLPRPRKFLSEAPSRSVAVFAEISRRFYHGLAAGLDSSAELAKLQLSHPCALWRCTMVCTSLLMFSPSPSSLQLVATLRSPPVRSLPLLSPPQLVESLRSPPVSHH